jgi:hypothetical protein
LQKASCNLPAAVRRQFAKSKLQFTRAGSPSICKKQIAIHTPTFFYEKCHPFTKWKLGDAETSSI